VSSRGSLQLLVSYRAVRPTFATKLRADGAPQMPTIIRIVWGILARRGKSAEARTEAARLARANKYYVANTFFVLPSSGSAHWGSAR